MGSGAEAEAASDWAGATAAAELERTAGIGPGEDATSTGAGVVDNVDAAVVDTLEEAVELVELAGGPATDDAEEMDDATDEDEPEG